MYLFIYLLLERGEGREKEGKKHQCVRETPIGCLLHTPQLGIWPTTQACTLIGNQTSDLSVHRPALNPLTHTSQG